MQDGLTGLPNRRHFLEVLGQKLSGKERTAVLFIDLDGFKPVNDAHGHDAGDAILKSVAMRLSHALGQDALVGRLGGDEFAVLVHSPVDDTTIAAQAAAAIESISTPMIVGGIRAS